MALERPRFPTTKLVEGYDMAEVDDLVDLVFKVLAQDEADRALTPQQIENVRFTPVRLREGYQMGAVDDWLDLAVAELRSGSGTTTAPAPDVTPAASSLDAPPPRRADQPTTSSAITEVKAGGVGVYAILAGIVVVLAVVVYALVG